ncbi:MAG: MlaA family lipoprotein [Gammaproteobacteria bacterium]
MHRAIVFWLCLSAALAGGGCAPKEWSFADDGAYDPLEPVNRVIYGFNQKADSWILKPLAKGYGYVPQIMRTGAGNFFDNLQEPRNVVNGVLQLRGADALHSAGRFVVNSTGGIGGLFDIASPVGLSQAEGADFGRTLRHYGFDNTPYLVLPLLGPSSFADATGSVADSYLDPASYLQPAARSGLAVLSGVHRRHSFLAFDDIAADAIDEYVFVRDIYEEKRRIATFDDDAFDDDEFDEEEVAAAIFPARQ